MAKETKQDRIVRVMHEQTVEHFHDLKSIANSPSCKESDVERWAQSFLKNCLGFSASLGFSIRAQETKGKLRPDLTVFKNDKPIFVVEVKKLGFDLNKSDFRSGKAQLSEYLSSLGGVKYGMLTNGTEWKLIEFSNGQVGGIEISSVDLLNGGDAIDCSRKAVEDSCYDLLDFHECSYSDSTWTELSKEALAFSPESLARAILSADIVKSIARSIKGEHAFKANSEVLTDKIYWLLENGLDDTIHGWGEAKELEFQKYIRSQKRAAHKSKGVTKRESVRAEAPLAVPPEGTHMPLIRVPPASKVDDDSIAS